MMAMIGDRRPGQHPEHLRQAVQLALQRRTGTLRRGHHVGDAPDLRGLARCRDHVSRRPPRHLSVLEDHVRPVTKRRLRIRNGAPVLGDWGALAGERSLLNLQGGRRDDSPVSRHHVTGLEQHHIARDQLVESISSTWPCRRTSRPRHLQLRQRFDAGPRLEFLGRTHDHVEDDQPETKTPVPI